MLAAFIGFFAAWVFFYAAFQPFNYDEIMEMHAIWLSLGRGPYTRVYIDHPPFAWTLYGPILKALPEDFKSLAALRFIGCLWSVLALGLWARAVTAPFKRGFQRLLALGALAAATFQAPILRTLAEFRTDHAAWAFTVGGLLLLSEEKFGPLKRWAASGFLFALSVMLTPKLALIHGAAFLAHASGLLTGKKPGSAGPLYFLAGWGLGFVLADGLCRLAGIDVDFYYRTVLPVHGRVMSAFAVPFALAKALKIQALAHPNTLLLMALSVLAVPWLLRNRAWRADKNLLIFLAFIFAQPVWVRYPYRQYVYPVLWALALPAAHLAVDWSRRFPRAVPGALIALVIAGLASEAVQATSVAKGGGLQKHVRFGNALLGLSPSGSRVSAQPPFHPVFRENATYFLSYTVNPGGPDLETYLEKDRELQPRVSEPAYLRDLERNAPSLIVPNPDFTSRRYQRALAAYISQKGPLYRSESLKGFTVLVKR